MFRPTQLVCSIQGTFNPIHTVSSEDIKTIKRIPKSLKNALRGEESTLRTYDIVTPFTIESNTSGMDCPNNIVEAPIQGLMTTYGYAISNPDEPNRVAVWFTGGSIEVSDSEYLDGWKKVFDKSRMPKRKLHELTCVLGAKFFMGAATAETMEEDGRMSYSLKRPVGGHDRAYLDMLYLDETVRIARSTQGVLYVCARVPYFPDE